jgi:hypothetical protein
VGFLSGLRERQIEGLAGPHLADGEQVLVWARARQPRSGMLVFQRSGFAYVTPDKFVVHWSGQSEGHIEVAWRSISAWGINKESRGGPILAIETADRNVFVQMPSSSKTSARTTTDLLRSFAERAPKIDKDISDHPRLGVFDRAHRDVSFSPRRRSFAGHGKRIIFTVVGLSLVLVGAVFLVLPGPGLLLLIPGLALLGAEYDWAEDVLHWVKERYRWTKEKLRQRRSET